MRYITSLLFVLLFTATPMFAFAHEDSGGHMMDWMGYGGWFGFGGWITMTLIWIILILGIVALLKVITNDKK